MKKNVTYVAPEKVAAIVSASGLRTQDLKGWTRVCGAEGRAVYVPKLKKAVGRVDVSGFTMEGPGFVAPHCGKFGSVEQQLDFSLPEGEILANLARLLDVLRELPAREKAKRAAFSPPAAPAPAAPVAETKAERLARIRAIAEKMGVPVSEKTVAELTEA